MKTYQEFITESTKIPGHVVAGQNTQLSYNFDSQNKAAVDKFVAAKLTEMAKKVAPGKKGRGIEVVEVGEQYDKKGKNLDLGIYWAFKVVLHEEDGTINGLVKTNGVSRADKKFDVGTRYKVKDGKVL
ncbi:hypothetical protein [Kosakonia phage 305]|uniref:Uncharacterized protein n=1 Tax=Kosakonia phage 305 TaxID=2863193 RepID=A0AAE7WFW8_9CAUD|nr:hypothetical protein PP421_gp197 [Kosakonia phage 305]QYN80403.1 hypothetical protein [Kosakonia phage 305]